MKTEEKEKEYHAAYIVYEQAMLHIHRLTADMKDKSLASITHYEIMMSLRKKVEVAVEKERENIEDAFFMGTQAVNNHEQIKYRLCSQEAEQKAKDYYNYFYGRHIK